MSGYLKFFFYAYVEEDSWQIAFRKYLLLKFISGIVTGGVMLLLYAKWLPNEFEKRKDKLWFWLVSPLLYCLLAFMLNVGIFFHTDMFFGNAGLLRINGVIMNKDFKLDRRGRKEYFVSISDTGSKLNYYFRVRSDVYKNIKREQAFNKEFEISKLGILYRKEQ
jgi:hypothetical protein